jgi:hypothetical protein
MYTLRLSLTAEEIRGLANRYMEEQLDESSVLAAGKDAASRGHLIKSEFDAITRWKSPRPKVHYDKNLEADIICVSRCAFGAEDPVRKVVKLTELQGVRVRAATAILHICFPDRFPLLDFRALQSLGVRPEESATWDDLKWLQIWPSYIDCCLRIHAETDIDLRTLDRALWQYSKEIEA